jgi:hydrogenase assembly chaperone HypC/HupF
VVSPETCHTCGDVAVEARVVEVMGDTAFVDVAGAREAVAIELVAPVAPGDLLLCHAGIAIRKVEVAVGSTEATPRAEVPALPALEREP